MTENSRLLFSLYAQVIWLPQECRLENMMLISQVRTLGWFGALLNLFNDDLQQQFPEWDQGTAPGQGEKEWGESSEGLTVFGSDQGDAERYHGNLKVKGERSHD